LHQVEPPGPHGMPLPLAWLSILGDGVMNFSFEVVMAISSRGAQPAAVKSVDSSLPNACLEQLQYHAISWRSRAGLKVLH